MDCVFCKIVQGEIPSVKVYEDDNVLAFLDIMPLNKGHTLVIPKKHYETLIDMPKNELEALISELHKLAKAVVEGVKAEGFNIVANNKKIAGQIVPHMHFHIIPRYGNDGIKIDWPTKKYKDDEMEEYKNKIISFL